MKASTWNDNILKIAEERVTQLVNEILSRSYGSCAKTQAVVQEVVEDLTAPMRQEMDGLKKQVGAMNDKIVALEARIEELRSNAKASGAPSKRKKATKKTPPKEAKGT